MVKLISKKYKLCKKIIVLLFYVVAVIYANISYANNFSIDKITYFLNEGVVAASISSEGETSKKLTIVENFVDHTFRVNFNVPKIGDPNTDVYGVPPDRLELFVGDSTAESNHRLISKTNKGINPVENVDSKFFPCFLIDNFSKEASGSNIYQNFIITIADVKGYITETIKAKKPKLDVSLKKINSEKEYDTLVLKNLGTEEIRVTGVVTGTYLVREGKDIESITVKTPIVVSPNGGMYEIKLSFISDLENNLRDISILKDDDNQFYQFNDAVGVFYKIGSGNNSMKSVIDIVCNNSLELIGKIKAYQARIKELEKIVGPDAEKERKLLTDKTRDLSEKLKERDSLVQSVDNDSSIIKYAFTAVAGAVVLRYILRVPHDDIGEQGATNDAQMTPEQASLQARIKSIKELAVRANDSATKARRLLTEQCTLPSESWHLLGIINMINTQINNANDAALLANNDAIIIAQMAFNNFIAGYMNYDAALILIDQQLERARKECKNAEAAANEAQAVVSDTIREFQN